MTGPATPDKKALNLGRKTFNERRSAMQKQLAREGRKADEQAVTDVCEFWRIRKVEDLQPEFYSAFVRDLEVSLRLPISPEFTIEGFPRASILLRATAASIQLIRSHVPQELLDLPHWIAGERRPRLLKKDNIYKSSKVPLNPRTGSQAKSNDPSTWGTFEEAAAFALKSIECFGVGVNLLGTVYLGLDLDNVIDPATGKLDPEAAEFIGNLPPTYTEVSPSGHGLRLFYRGRKPVGFARCQVEDAFGSGKDLEVYDGESGARYLTVTGKVFGERHGIAQVSDKDLDELRKMLGPTKGNENQAKLDKPSRPKQGSYSAGATERVEVDDHDLARARWGLLDAKLLDPDNGYHPWFRVLPALKPWGDEGLRLGIEWSRPSKDFDEQEIRHKWPGIKGTGIHCLFGMFDDADPGWRARYDRERGQHVLATQGGPNSKKTIQLPPLGQLTNGKLVLSTKRTMPTAEAFVQEFFAHSDGRGLHSYAGQFYRWDGSRYVPVEDEALRNTLQPWLHKAWTVRRRRDEGGFSLEWTPFDANSATIKQALDAIRDYAHLAATTPMPCWLGDGSEKRPRSSEILACKSMLLHIPSGRVLQPTPLFFNTSALKFDHDASAKSPLRWELFLEQVFDGDAESIQLLQEYMGYLLVPDTSQQKILLMVGPRRSGKGTIARVLTELLGSDNVASPTTVSLSGTFGLQPLIGKSLALVSDARFHGEGVATVVERLLCISGEDAITVDRKFLGAVTMKLPTRFLIVSNEVPRLHDTSTALAGRFLILQLRKSFYGREDPQLTTKLLAELPGILLWAMAGWKRLHERGRFVAPECSNEAVAELEDLGSPVQAFMREKCIVGPGHRVEVDLLFTHWVQWCREDGRSLTTTKTTFGRDLRTVHPGIKRRRGTEDVPFYEGISLRS